MLTMLCVLQLSAQEDWYKFEIKSLVNRELIVHSRLYSTDNACSKNTFEFEVPVNTVAIVYAYRSVLSEVPVPGLRLLSGLTKCVGGAASFVNPNVSTGLNTISEGLSDLSIPSGTGDVDIYLFTKKEAIYEFRAASTSDCEKFYDPKYDLLSQKSGTKTINFAKPIEKSFYIYLGLLNKDLNDAITVRIEAVAITAVRMTGKVASNREPVRLETSKPIAAGSSQEFANHQVIKNETFVRINGVKMYIHKMRPGETIEDIAKAYNTTVQIISINNQDLKGKFQEGVMLKIPDPTENFTSSSQEYAYHQVEKNQSLYDIARRYGVNEDDIIRYNPKAKNGINTGEILKIPVGYLNDPDRKNLDFVFHTVKKNESVHSICSLYRVDVDVFYKYNPKSKTSLKDGDVVVLPKGESFYNDH